MKYRRRKKIIRHWILLELPQYCYISKTVTSQKQTILLRGFCFHTLCQCSSKKADSFPERSKVAHLVPECSCHRGGEKISFDWTWTSLTEIEYDTPQATLLPLFWTINGFQCWSKREAEVNGITRTPKSSALFWLCLRLIWGSQVLFSSLILKLISSWMCVKNAD